MDIVSSANADDFPLPVAEDDSELVKAAALSRLMRELEAGTTDQVSYSEDEVYKIFGIEP